MKSILICPAERLSLAKMAEVAPLVTLPILGRSLAEYWLEHLAALGAKEVEVLAADRPEQVRAHLGDGARWGLRVEVTPEIRELTAAEARAKYLRASNANWLPDPNDIIVLDHLPGLVRHRLLESAAEWFEAVFAWLSRTASPLRVGLHEVQPGVWAGLHTHIAPSAQLQPPCWLGENVWIGANAVVGPMAVVEDRVFVEAGATISRSVVGTETFLGGLADLKDSLAWGSLLVNWRTGSAIEVADPFLLCALHQRHSPLKRANWLARVAALWLMLATLPAAASVMLRSKLRGNPLLRKKQAVCPQSRTAAALDHRLVYYELASVNRWLRRWPQLWNVIRGEFTWVGNRPLSPSDAAELRNEFERLWLAAPIGLISLADAAGCAQSFSDEARAHASYYAVKANWRLDWRIVARALGASLFGVRPAAQTEAMAVSFRPPVVKGGG